MQIFAFHPWMMSMMMSSKSMPQAIAHPWLMPHSPQCPSRWIPKSQIQLASWWWERQQFIIIIIVCFSPKEKKIIHTIMSSASYMNGNKKNKSSRFPFKSSTKTWGMKVALFFRSFLSIFSINKLYNFLRRNPRRPYLPTHLLVFLCHLTLFCFPLFFF